MVNRTKLAQRRGISTGRGECPACKKAVNAGFPDGLGDAWCAECGGPVPGAVRTPLATVEVRREEDTADWPDYEALV